MQSKREQSAEPDFVLVHAPLAFWWVAMMAHVYCAFTRTGYAFAWTLGLVGCIAMAVVLVPVALEALRVLRARRTHKMRELVSVQLIVSLLATACWVASLLLRPSPQQMSLFAWLAMVAGTLYAGNLVVVGSLIAIEAKRR